MKYSILVTSILLTQVLFAQNQSMDSLSYSFGVMVASNLKDQGIKDLDANSVALAITDVMNGEPLKVDLNSAKSIINTFFKEKQMEQYKGTIEEGKKFLAENAKRAEVTTLPSGLQYEVLQEGPEGPSPTATTKVTVHYEGKLLNGTVFDSSYKRGQPTSFGVNQVISGWTEALQLMKAGDKWKLFIPYDLAYGERKAGNDITPFSTLVFEVELISF